MQPSWDRQAGAENHIEVNITMESTPYSSVEPLQCRPLQNDTVPLKDHHGRHDKLPHIPKQLVTVPENVKLDERTLSHKRRENLEEEGKRVSQERRRKGGESELGTVLSCALDSKWCQCECAANSPVTCASSTGASSGG